MKGCPLSCFWCSNPEGQAKGEECSIVQARCIGCGRCLDACPLGAISVSDKGIINTDRNKCIVSGVCAKECVAVCPSKCRELIGRPMTVEEVMVEVKKDAPFYTYSKGGITIGGGEPLMQADFVSMLLKRCKELEFHTAVETSGYGKWEDLEKILKFTDWLFFDVKHMDADKHRESTRKNNKRVLENLKKVAHHFPQLPLAIRTCLINGYNSSETNIEATAKFLAELGRKIEYYELLLYHRLGESKYSNLGKKNIRKFLEAPTKEHTEKLKALIESWGIEARVA